MSETPFLPAEAAADLDLLDLARSGPVHFMGICGAGMSALAEYVARAGGQVTGCDAKPGGVTPTLRSLGVSVMQGHDEDHVAAASAVVTTSAVPAEHPELAAARARGIPVLKRATALGALVNRGRVIAVAGTHGKTTTTGMLATVLDHAGLNPTAFVGGRMPGWDSGFREGGSLYVVEADEYDRSFLALRPDMAVVTTVEPDHMDIYDGVEALAAAFAAFLDPLPADGMVAVCADDPGAARVADVVRDSRAVTYGIGGNARLTAEGLEPGEDGTRFHAVLDDRTLGEFRLQVPGRHNVRNALATLAVSLHAGAELSAIREGLTRFGGVDRRFQRLGEARDVVVVDDYAHHPTEVAATLTAARERFGDRRVVAVFQPHLYSRTRDLWREFGHALARADAVWVTDVYAAREAPIEGVTGELVADAAREAGGDVVYHADVSGIEDALADWLEAGDVCLLMGAGDISEHAHALLALLTEGGS